MRQNRLVPTPTIDRNGKATTVYRRAEPPAAAAASLAKALPAVAADPAGAAPRGPLDDAPIAVVLRRVSTLETSRLQREHFITRFAEIAPDRELNEPPGGVVMSGRDAYVYLSMGLPLEEGALLHFANPDPVVWGNDAVAQRWATIYLNSIQEGGANGDRVDEAVALMRTHGVEPVKLSQLIANGLSNRHVHGSLNADQLVHLLTTFRYDRSSVAGRVTPGAHAMDRLVEGTLPFSLTELHRAKWILSGLAEALAPRGGVFAEAPDPLRWVSPEDAAVILGDEDLIMDIADVMGERGPTVNVAAAWHAIRMFGKKEALACHPAAILERTSDGRLVGVEGWRRATSFVAKRFTEMAPYAGRMSGSRCLIPTRGRGYGQPFEMYEILDVLDSGLTEDEAVEMLLRDLTPPQIVALATGATTAPLVGGAL